MLCKECKEPLPEGRRICRNCGTRNVPLTDHATATERPKNCKDCGVDLGGRRICQQCGARHFTTTRTEPPKEPVRQEGKLCKNCDHPLAEGRRICRNCGTRNVPTETGTEQEKPSLERTATVGKRSHDATPKQVSPVKKAEYCLHCNQELIEGKDFCANCGEKTVKESPKPEPPQKEFCIHCGNELMGGKTFCGTCGESVGGTPPPPVLPPKKEEIKRCHSCGGELMAGKPFCGFCGESVEGSIAPSRTPPPEESPQICTICGGQILNGETFCGVCGGSVGGAAPPPPPISNPTLNPVGETFSVSSADMKPSIFKFAKRETRLTVNQDGIHILQMAEAAEFMKKKKPSIHKDFLYRDMTGISHENTTDYVQMIFCVIYVFVLLSLKSYVGTLLFILLLLGVVGGFFEAFSRKITLQLKYEADFSVHYQGLPISTKKCIALLEMSGKQSRQTQNDPTPFYIHENRGNPISFKTLIGNVLCTGLLFALYSFILGEGMVETVKNAAPTAYPNITYNQAFSYVFENREWRYFDGENGEQVVEFTGTAKSNGNQFIIQFFVENIESSSSQVWVELHHFGINGEAQNDFVKALLLISIFEAYEEKDVSLVSN